MPTHFSQATWSGFPVEYTTAPHRSMVPHSSKEALEWWMMPLSSAEVQMCRAYMSRPTPGTRP
jgi:hypothetical protein